MTNKRYTSISKFAERFKISPARAKEAELKALLVKSIVKEIIDQELTHQEVATLTGVARSTITGIINGSLKKITLDRLVRVLTILGPNIEMKIKKAA